MKFYLFSPAPIYPEFEEAMLTFSLQDSLDQLGSDDPWVKTVLNGKTPAQVASEVVRGTKLTDPAVRKSLVEGGEAAVNASTDPLIALARKVDPFFREIRKEYEDNVESVMDAPAAPQIHIPSPIPIPTPPTTVPDASALRVARLYDAVEFSVNRFLSREVGRKAVVIAALADDARSEATLRDALRALKESDVIAYVLQVQHSSRGRDDCDIRHIFRNEDENRIGRLAVETGGRVIRVEGFEKMQAAFEQIAEELHHQYSLGYRPTNQTWDGAFRKVAIDAGKGYKISARDGYYAKPRNQ